MYIAFLYVNYFNTEHGIPKAHVQY